MDSSRARVSTVRGVMMSQELADKLGGRVPQRKESLGEAVAVPTLSVAIVAIVLGVMNDGDQVFTVLMIVAPIGMAMLITLFVGRYAQHSTYRPDEWRGFSNLCLSAAIGIATYAITAHHYHWSFGASAALALWATVLAWGMFIPLVMDWRWRPTNA